MGKATEAIENFALYALVCERRIFLWGQFRSIRSKYSLRQMETTFVVVCHLGEHRSVAKY